MHRVVYTADEYHYLGEWLVAAYEIGRMLPSDSLWIVPGTGGEHDER